MDRTVRTAVIPAAGMGTRFLPATKVVAKELLPVVDRPAIQLVVEEAARCGIQDVVLVTSVAKPAVAQHFDPAPELESALRGRGDTQRADVVADTSGGAVVRAVHQDPPQGLGHAVACAAAAVGEGSFAVLLGDDLIDARDGLLTTMVAAHRQTGQAVIALMEMDDLAISGYGCAVPGDPVVLATGARALSVTDLVEKPAPGTAPSNLAVIGRYVLPSRVFGLLAETAAGRGGEIQLTDALARLASIPVTDGGGLIGVVFTGRRYDTGNPLDYLKTQVQLGCADPVLGKDFTSWLQVFAASMPPSQ